MAIIIKILLFFHIIKINGGVYINEDAENVLRSVLDEFDQDPENSRYDHVILTGNLDSSLLPKIFVWCPIKHHKLNILCPVHDCELQCKEWTHVLAKESHWNPRLVYDLGGNVIFVQRSYECISGSGSQCQWPKHSYLSGSKAILDIIPKRILKQLPIILHYRSAFTTDLRDDILTNIELGQNFLKISERLASLNFRKFQQRFSVRDPTDNGNCEELFYQNILYSFPSNDKLMQFFLEYFESIKHTYSVDMKKITGTVLSIDHTFKVSKHIGIVRNDDAFVKQFENCLFAMNEVGEIVAWRFTKSPAFNEIKDLLVDLKQRHTDKGIGIEVIILDDCCKMRRLYQGVFGVETEIKLDLFHACQRVVQTVDDKDTKAQFCKEFGLIFRCDGDVGQERQQSTPKPEIIIGNLEQFLHRWHGKLNVKTIKAIDDLRKHITNGCLSCILPGEGTEKNERFHRHLSRSLLVGANNISPELAIACLTVAIYVWNCRRKKRKHSKNQRVFPIIPPECLTECSEVTDTYVPLRCGETSNAAPNCFIRKTKELQHVSESDSSEYQTFVKENVVNATSVENLKNDNVLSYIIRRALQLQELFNNIINQCTHRAMTIGNFPLYEIEKYAKLIRTSSDKSVDKDGLQFSIESGKNMETLLRNLSAFHLTIENVVGDGNCCFHSITVQLSKLLSLSNDEMTDENVQNYTKKLKDMGFGQSTSEDATLLRHLFIQELLRNIHQYKNWIDLEEDLFLQEIEFLQKEGAFSSTLADLCVKVCCNVLGLPIVVITSYPSAPHFSFVPAEIGYAKPIYIAFNHTPPGHYDATKGLKIDLCSLRWISTIKYLRVSTVA